MRIFNLVSITNCNMNFFLLLQVVPRRRKAVRMFGVRQEVLEGLVVAQSPAETFRGRSLRVSAMQEEVLHAKQAQRTRKSSHVSIDIRHVLLMQSANNAERK